MRGRIVLTGWTRCLLRFSDLRNDRSQQAAYLPNYAVEIAGGKNNITLYMPFLAQGGPGWLKELVSRSIIFC
jgi:hypothetical protein